MASKMVLESWFCCLFGHLRTEKNSIKTVNNKPKYTLKLIKIMIMPLIAGQMKFELCITSKGSKENIECLIWIRGKICVTPICY